MTDLIVPAFKQAINLIITGNPDLYGAVYRSFYTAGLGTLLSCVWSLPIAVILGLYNFRGKWFVKGIFNALIGVPTVALGLVLYLFLSRQGEFGSFHLLYTLNGITLGQAILVTPIIVSFSSNALSTSDIQLRDLAKTLGASGLRTDLTIIRETFWSMILSITASFNRAFGELGIALLVGGNFVGATQVLTTAIGFQTDLGHFANAVAYGIILVGIVIIMALTISLIERLRQVDSWGKLSLWRGLGGS